MVMGGHRTADWPNEVRIRRSEVPLYDQQVLRRRLSSSSRVSTFSSPISCSKETPREHDDAQCAVVVHT